MFDDALVYMICAHFYKLTTDIFTQSHAIGDADADADADIFHIRYIITACRLIVCCVRPFVDLEICFIINYCHGESSSRGYSTHFWSCKKNIIFVVLQLVLSQAMTTP